MQPGLSGNPQLWAASSGDLPFLSNLISFAPSGQHSYLLVSQSLTVKKTYWCAKGNRFEDIGLRNSFALVPCTLTACERWTGDPARPCVHLADAPSYGILQEM